MTHCSDPTQLWQFQVQRFSVENDGALEVRFPMRYLNDDMLIECVFDTIVVAGDVFTSIIVDGGPNTDSSTSTFDTEISLDAGQIALDVAANVNSGFQRVIRNCVGIRVLNRTGGVVTGRLRRYVSAQVVRDRKANNQ